MQGAQTFFKDLNDQLADQGVALSGDSLRLGDPGPGCIHVNTTTHKLVDGYGRERYFHGVNVVVKGPPWIPRQDKFDPHWSFVEEDMQLLQDWGLNAIRLGNSNLYISSHTYHTGIYSHTRWPLYASPSS